MQPFNNNTPRIDSLSSSEEATIDDLEQWLNEAEKGEDRLTIYNHIREITIFYGVDTLTIKNSNIRKLPPIPFCVTKLSITNCPNVTVLPDDLSQLTELRLEGFTKITAWPDNLLKLRCLKVINCSGKIELPENLSTLEMLFVWDSAIIGLPQDLSNLTSLSLIDCPELTALLLDENLPNLRWIKLNQCPNVICVLYKHVYPAGHFETTDPALKELQKLLSEQYWKKEHYSTADALWLVAKECGINSIVGSHYCEAAAKEGNQEAQDALKANEELIKAASEGNKEASKAIKAAKKEEKQTNKAHIKRVKHDSKQPSNEKQALIQLNVLCKQGKSRAEALWIVAQQHGLKSKVGYCYCKEAAELGNKEAKQAYKQLLFHEKLEKSSVNTIYKRACELQKSKSHHDQKFAIKYFEYAYSKGHTKAQFALGQICLANNDIDQAIFYLQPLAIHGKHSEAMYLLAQIYQSNDDEATAIEYYKLAAENGHANAAYALTKIFQKTTSYSSTTFDPDTEKYLKIAADLGHPDAAFEYAQLWATRVTSIDCDAMKNAKKYFIIAYKHGHSQAGAEFDLLYNKFNSSP